MTEHSVRPATVLNQSCFCTTVDQDNLRQALAREIGDDDLMQSIAATRPHLFSSVSVFVAADDIRRMREVVQAIDSVAANPAYQTAALSWAPEIAKFDPGPIGALMGYDFHLGNDGPKLIEVNTNAGGAFLNAFLARAQRACCPEVQHKSSGSQAHAFDAAVLKMFKSEWRRQRGAEMLSRIAIVDVSPSEQYLYPEFVLAQRLFMRSGIEALIADPQELDYEGGRAMQRHRPIDLVYNRLVDFALDSPRHEFVRRAYLDGAIVLTPHPRAHALLADKRNLTLLSDSNRLKSWGLDEEMIGVLIGGIPRTLFVTPETAHELWGQRRQLFFKPATSYGSKGAYRGDKLTRGVWETIVRGGYVAQSFADPGERMIKVDGKETALKCDIRLYTYAGSDLLIAARLYQGQTTNLRTKGGGFAPVFEV